MKQGTTIIIGVILVMALFVTLESANALTDKERWEKDFGDGYRSFPLDPPVILEHGGPDQGGYYYIDSDDNALNAVLLPGIDEGGHGTFSHTVDHLLPIALGDARFDYIAVAVALQLVAVEAG